jgi:CRP-like cAMP-binding protein
MVSKFAPPYDLLNVLAKTANGATPSTYPDGEVFFVQGDAADAVFYIQHGRVKKTYVSRHGKERVVAILNAGEFFGVGCVVGRTKRMMTATAMTACSVARIEKPVMLRLLYAEPALAEIFISFLIERNSHYQEDLVDHLFNSSEKRLARTLMLLSDVGKYDGQEMVVPKISQETLAEIVGTTRSRINYFMKKFRQLGLIDYNDRIRINPSLLNMVAYERFECQVE